jgi:hypothetical protein
MYAQSDPRSKLTPAAAAKAATSFGEPSISLVYADPPQLDTASERSWYVRGQNFLTAYSELQPGAELSRVDQPDEYLLLIEDAATTATVEWNGTRLDITGQSVTFIPAGSSVIRFPKGGVAVRFLTTRSTDLVALCANAAGYDDPNIPPLEPWPDPVGGFKVRNYSLDVPPAQGRMGRLFRGSTFMINCQYPRSGPRTTLSPHEHADFQQCSLILAGEYVHHLRWPWTTNKADWREDRHESCASPSVTFIPAQVIHTSEAIDAGTNILYDVFCPPRHDFSAQSGWVLNAADYPEPEQKP